MEFHTGHPMCSVPLGLDDDDMFSPSGSSFSLSSSSYGPHTPTSGRSTPPQNSFDYGSSFASSIDGHSIELTPPSSATNSYFPFAFKGDGVSDFSHQPAFPLTPSRSQLSFPSFSHHSGYGGGGVQLSPSQHVEYFCGDNLFQLPVVVSPQQQLPSSSSGWESWRWPQGDSHSPISFGEHTPKRPSVMVRHPPLKFEAEEEDMEMRKKYMMKENHHSLEPSAMGLLPSPLHRIKEDPSSPPPPFYSSSSSSSSSRQRHARMRDSKRGVKDGIDGGGGGRGGVEPKAMHRCPVPGCTYGPYRRNEHLKRHLRTHGIGGDQEEWICEFCPPAKPKTFNRRDNFTAHIKLHTRPKGKNSRTEYNVAAIEVYNREQARISCSKKFRGKKNGGVGAGVASAGKMLKARGVMEGGGDA
ncbi:hypothetical protein B0T21DRAFT_407034 [Apiosordaria backusii]|uniref:C2H2-type domain-containing protein n=1 Tax=Apiosordaria backusii TaxID=314023 RepID=A0AA40EZS3_9PEZI|nr:hypothetical protein B0T21DRAFT_407034 [Apiosordaria backusii]